MAEVDLGLVVGPQGPQGLKGDKGDTGPQGAKGDKGDTGPQGAKGDKGDTGPQGAKGDKGDTGTFSEEDLRRVTTLEAENALLKELISGVDAPIYRTATGNPVTFSDAAAGPVKILSVTTPTPTQTGSGNPSPDNVRPITGGYTSVTVTRTGEDGTDTQSVTVSADEAGTIYGGTLNVTTGELTVSFYGMTVDGSSVKANSSTKYDPNYRFNVPYPNVAKPLYQGGSTFCLCDKMISSATGTVSYPAAAKEITCFAFGLNLLVTFPASTGITTTAQANAWFAENRPTVVYQLATPMTYQLTPAELSTVAGYNAISADAGSLEVRYQADTALSFSQL